jgi:hypothetical protein
MTGAMVVISRAQMRTSYETVVGFLRAAGCAVGRVRVRLSDTSGVAVEEEMWFNNTDAAALAKAVAEHIARSASGRSDLEATVTVSDGG